MVKKIYYKPKSLVIGIMIFGLSCLLLGALFMTSTKNGIVDSADKLRSIYALLCIAGIFVGEGFILNAASYDALKNKGEDNDSN